MPTYKITVYEVYTHDLVITANDRATALYNYLTGHGEPAKAIEGSEKRHCCGYEYGDILEEDVPKLFDKIKNMGCSRIADGPFLPSIRAIEEIE